MEKTRHLHQHEQEKHIHDAPADQAFARTAETFQLISDSRAAAFETNADLYTRRCVVSWAADRS